MITTEENQKNRQTYSMKRFLFLCATTFALSMLATSCEDSGDLEDEYLPPSVGIDSSYSPNIVAVVPGYERVEVIWELNNSDNGKDILNSYIYWNGGRGVHEATIAKLEPVVYTNADESEISYYRQTFEISEGDYTFYVRNLDADKYVSSASSTITASVYGPTAEAQLMDRPIKTASYDSNNIYRLTWDESTTCAGSTITYNKITGQISTVESAADDEFADLFDANETASITLETLHLPSRTVSRQTTDDEDAKNLADVLGKDYLNVAQAGLDTIAAPTTTKQMLGDGSKFYYVTTKEELQALFESWEYDYRTDEEIEAGADIVSYADAIKKDDSAQRLAENLARKSNVNLKVLAGRYEIGVDDITEADNDIYKILANEYGIENTTIFPITGDNNYIDLTGAVFVVNTACVSTFDYELFMLYFLGDNNTVVNGSFTNEGSKYDDPGGKGGGNAIVLDGRKNTALNVTVDVMGSVPYGYGEMFGKGSITTISANKHCGVLIRGEFNTVDGCQIKNLSFGHLLYMQGAFKPLIQNTYVEAEFSTTDAILEEEGFGTAADLIDFLTAYFYRVPAGYALPLGEDSYRTYASGSCYLRNPRTLKLQQNYTSSADNDYDSDYFTTRDGLPYSQDSKYKSMSSANVSYDEDEEEDAAADARLTISPTLRNSVVKDGRAGISLALGDCGEYDVEGMVLHGSQGGFCPASGQTLTNCSSDIIHGPTIGLAYSTHNKIIADITIIPYEGEHYNYNGTARDNGYIANIKGGLGHQMEWKVAAGLFYEDNYQIGEYNSGINSGAYFQMAGDNTAYGELAEIENENLSGGTFKNESYYPIRLGNRAGESYYSNSEGITYEGSEYYVRIGSYITAESEYGTRLDPNNVNEKSAFWTIVNRNHFYLHDKENLGNVEVSYGDSAGTGYEIIPCPYGTKGAWIVKAIDMTALRAAKGFPIYHTDLEAYIKTMGNGGSAGGDLTGLEGGEKY